MNYDKVIGGFTFLLYPFFAEMGGYHRWVIELGEELSPCH